MAKITSISSLGWSHYTLYEALPRMANMGFSRVEIASFYCYCFHFNFGSPRSHELKDVLAQLQLTPVCLNYSASPYSAWETEDIDRFVADWERKLPDLQETGIPMMTVSFGQRNVRGDQDEQLANAVKAYNRIGKIATRYDVRLAIEVPHLYKIHFRPEQVFWIFDRLSCDNVGAVVDSSHWGIIGYDLDEFFSRLGNRLWHVHLRDSRGPDTADRKQELELTPGKGAVDFRKFAKSLDSVNYRGDVSIEFEYRDVTLEAIHHEFVLGLTHLAECGWILPAQVKRRLLSK